MAATTAAITNTEGIEIAAAITAAIESAHQRAMSSGNLITSHVSHSNAAATTASLAYGLASVEYRRASSDPAAVTAASAPTPVPTTRRPSRHNTHGSAMP